MMIAKNKQSLWQIVGAVLGFGVILVIVKQEQLSISQQAILYAIPYLIVGYDVFKKAIIKLLKGNVFSEHFLMAIATLGAFMLSFITHKSEFSEAIFVMVFYRIGEFVEDIAENRSEKSIAGLLELRPELAHLERENHIVDINPQELQEGQIIAIYPGEKIAIDGLLVTGKSFVDTAALTGESLPKQVKVGDQVLSGMINKTGVIRVKVLHSMEDSTLSKILDLLKHSVSHRSKSERFITKFASVYTPTVVCLSLLLAILPPLLSHDFIGNFSTWLSRSLTFLVISCPCALVISIPLCFFGGIGACSKIGVLLKGANHLESLASLETLLFDKTGTLTKGVFEVTALHSTDIPKEQLLHLASHVESFSKHPIAKSLQKAYQKESDNCSITNVTEIAGYGVNAIINGHKVAVGNTKLMESLGVICQSCSHTGTIVHVAIDEKYAGHIVISDVIKSHAKQSLAKLKEVGIKHLVMLTGDRLDIATKTADKLDIEEFHANLLPSDKVSELEKHLAQKKANTTVGFVGDGINDAPVLAKADLGIAMGGMGSDLAIEMADVVIMDDQLSKIADAIKIAHRTLFITHENIIVSIGIKLLVLVLASLGLATMWLGIFADVGTTVLVTLNAMRTLSVKK